MLILYKATIQKKIITLHLRLQEDRKMHKGMRTITVRSVVIKTMIRFYIRKTVQEWKNRFKQVSIM